MIDHPRQVDSARSIGPPTLSTLRLCVRNWILSQPFHNLDVLAASRTGGQALTRDEAIERCTRRLGGPCHVQAAGFLDRLTSLGFDASLGGATISSANDHLVVHVRLNGRLWLCDVGNGQPYVEPFPSDDALSFSHLGWRIETHPIANGVELRRSSPDQPEPRIVYRASIEPRTWSDFSSTIHRHHQELGFGPFLAGLRAVRMSDAEMLTLRDKTFTVYTANSWTRTELEELEISDLLRDRFGLAGLPIDDAIDAWRNARRPR